MLLQIVERGEETRVVGCVMRVACCVGWLVSQKWREDV